MGPISVWIGIGENRLQLVARGEADTETCTGLKEALTLLFVEVVVVVVELRLRLLKLRLIAGECAGDMDLRRAT